jgi:hypothetical protein
MKRSFCWYHSHLDAMFRYVNHWYLHFIIHFQHKFAMRIYCTYYIVYIIENILYILYTPILRELHWLPIVKRIDFKIALLVFKCINNVAPVYLCVLIHLYAPSRALRSASTCVLVTPRHASNIHRRAFSVCGPLLWNSLPVNIRCESNLNIFKCHLKTFLFTQYFYP